MSARRRGLYVRVVVICSFLSFLKLASFAQTPAIQDPGEQAGCSTCHDQGQKLAKSAHVKAGCLECHPKHQAYPHPEGIPKPACATCHADVAADYSQSVHGQAAKKGNEAAPNCGVCHGDVHEVAHARSEAFRRTVPEICGMCHTDVVEQYKGSIHGKAVAAGNRDAPVCTDCHGEHKIFAPKNAQSTVNSAHIRDTCGRCHSDVKLARRYNLPLDRVTSFDQSYHGLAAEAGSQTVANCASCHGVHNILPSSDSASMINPANLPATCGKCHPGAGTRFAIGKIHWVEGKSEPAPVRMVRLFYIFIIPLTIGLMFLHHFGDFARKLIRLRLAPREASVIRPRPIKPELRMYGPERVQHLLLVLSFVVLVWTGFALKYPDGWWAQPLVMWESRWPVRGTIHRIAAVVMIGVAVIHVITLLFSRRLRNHWIDLFPRRADAVEALQMLFYNLGLRATKPAVSAHSYVEKAEYWAVVWGTFIMGLTGLMLWFVRYTLVWLPKEWLDVATAVHFYEAVLASLAILIWHFYTVIFDPDVYPVDPAWLTGFTVRKRSPHPPQHPPEPKPHAEEAASIEDAAKQQE